MDIVFVTSNRNKIREARRILGMQIKHKAIKLDEIQSMDSKVVAAHKARAAHAILKRPVIVEDTGLYIDGLGGFPGALVKWAVDGIGYERLCRLVDLCKNRQAHADTCIALCDGKKVKIFSGRVRGRISSMPQGSGNFGWDCIFVPEGFNETFAQMSPEEKDSLSMRRIAFSKLSKFISSRR